MLAKAGQWTTLCGVNLAHCTFIVGGCACGWVSVRVPSEYGCARTCVHACVRACVRAAAWACVAWYPLGAWEVLLVLGLDGRTGLRAWWQGGLTSNNPQHAHSPQRERPALSPG
jgi:hypothetical protein